MSLSARRFALSALFGVASAVFGAQPVVAAEAVTAYPSKPIRIVVPYTPGGPADTLARLFAQKFNEAWGQSTIVDNRPGGNTFIGAEIVAKAQPDGYTLFIAFVGTLSINPGLYRKLPYDPVKDFEPISMLAMVPLILVVNPNVPAKNVKELIAHAKANPGKLTFSSGGVGQGSHLGGEIFKSMSGVDMVHVPYKGNAQAAAEVVGGHITMIFDGMSSSLPFVKSGKLRAIGITTAKRATAVPDLPTLAEQGLTGYDVGSWVGILATGGTPKPIIDKLHAEVSRLLASAEMKSKIAAIGLDPLGMTPAEFRAYIKSETTKWVGAIKAAGIKPE